jgi:uncharacterized protein (DUF1800 family)
MQQALRDGPERTIERLLQPQGEAFNRTLDDFEASAIDRDSASIEGLREWWLRRMIQTPYPLLEKMTLFWHNHFAISNAKVKSGWLMHQHVHLLRSYALGRLQPLLAALVRDPALLLGLDGAAHRKARPNEEFARTFLEQLTLGPGQVSARDVREAARTMTGWFVLRSQLRFLEHERDAGRKTLFGQTGNWTEEDLVRLVLQQTAPPRHLVRQLYRWLISESQEPDQALLAPLAAALAKDYDVGRLVGTMLRSNLFYSDHAYRRRVKSPIEFALGIIRGLETVVGTTRLGHDLEALGQNLGQPPSIKGWPGGTAWINRTTLVGRSNLAAALLSGGNPYGDKVDPLAMAQKHGQANPEAAGPWLIDLFFQGDLPKEVVNLLLPIGTDREGDPQRGLRRFVHTLATLPEFQLA